ncbi:hypothetical protein H0264_35625 [Nocardia huaxiensis]|uniref:Uncharacterized protein n=1 Tax=Nocardia huaxiensis TaxID=2755382 RepID=A0A7D6VHY8_9NOCA|nr:hypothetical protein [Nocardia huaxiensis]QLY30396.1 hypothetical protein H0264_35625 [Nocardia huaxiensis]
MRISFRPKRIRSADHLGAAMSTKVQRTRMVPVREASAVARPNTVPQTYLEQEFDELAIEQLREHAAAGEAAAHQSVTTAAGLELGRAVGHELVGINAPLVVAARDNFLKALTLLSPFVKRKAGSRWVYFLIWILLLGGDIAGITGAAVAYGEVPMLAGLQALSVSVTTVLAGLAGAEFKYLKAAQERQSEDGALVPELAPYRTVLFGPISARRLVLIVTVVSMFIAVSVAIGIYSLRASVEGETAGMVYGTFACAVAVGSWWNSYRHADAVADKIDAARQAYRRELRAHTRMTWSWTVRRAERAAARSALIRDEHRLHGEAAAARISALKFEALQQNPDIVGHGPGVGEIGRKPRQVAVPESNGAVV